jgi:DNA-dependent RNA polymerase auxiliary subunit epsilon
MANFKVYYQVTFRNRPVSESEKGAFIVVASIREQATAKALSDIDKYNKSHPGLRMTLLKVK